MVRCVDAGWLAQGWRQGVVVIERSSAEIGRWWQKVVSLNLHPAGYRRRRDAGDPRDAAVVRMKPGRC